MNAITNLIQISTSTSSGNVEALGWEPNATAFFNIFRMAMLFVYIKSVSVAGARWVKMWVRYYTSVKSTPFFMKSVLQALTVQIKNSLGLVILQWHARIDGSSIICKRKSWRGAKSFWYYNLSKVIYSWQPLMMHDASSLQYTISILVPNTNIRLFPLFNTSSAQNTIW